MKKLFQTVVAFFRSGKAEQVFGQVSVMVPAATAIVQAIAALTPNRTVAEIAKAYEQYGLPVVEHLQATAPDQRGYVLLDLASKVLAKHYPALPANVLNTAVQVAVTAVRAV